MIIVLYITLILIILPQPQNVPDEAVGGAGSIYMYCVINNIVSIIMIIRIYHYTITIYIYMYIYIYIHTHML